MRRVSWWIKRHGLSATGVVFCLALLAACSHTPKSAAAKADIKDVLAKHEPELLSISGVVGVYVDVLPDRKTKCLKVLLAREDPLVQRRVPKELDGYKVETEVSGQIRPFR